MRFLFLYVFWIAIYFFPSTNKSDLVQPPSNDDPSTNKSDFLVQSPSNDDLINTTCQKCADISTVFDYTFCVTSIQAVTASRTSQLRGLAIVAMELALENATATVSTIEKLILSKAYGTEDVKWLRDCLEDYSDAISNVVTAIGAFVADQFSTANIFMSSVVEEPMTCEAMFRHQKGEVSPLAKQNYDMFEISIISLCIIEQAVLEPYSPLK